MYRHIFRLALIGTFSLQAFPTFASDDLVLACATSNPSSKDWVPEAVVIKIDGGSLKALVVDKYTQQIFDAGALAEFSRPAANRIKLNWQLVGVKDGQDRAQTVNFKMSINAKTGKFTYSGLGESFFVTPGSARGHCIEVE